MIPATMLFPADDMLYPAQTSPELRRADMYNRARREEMDALLYNVNPRHNVSFNKPSRNTRSTVSLGGVFTGLRNGIGNMLITAGNRIQNPA